MTPRPVSGWALGIASLLVMVLETLRATIALANPEGFADGLSFVGMGLPLPVVAVGGPFAATFGLIGIGLSWRGRRAGHAIVLGFATAFAVTHVLDQFGRPGPRIGDIGAVAGVLGAWAVMVWAWLAVFSAVLAARALFRPG